jgi:hypothetical protein
MLFYQEVDDINNTIIYKEILGGIGYKTISIPKCLCNSRIYFRLASSAWSGPTQISDTNVVNMIRDGNCIQGDFLIAQVLNQPNASATIKFTID